MATSSASSKLLNLNQGHTFCLFGSKSYEVEVMITSLTEMQELPNFGHMTTYTIKFDSCGKFLLVTSLTEIMM